MKLEGGETITRFIREHGLKNVLELGFDRGVSTCYIAAALEEQGCGHLISIDRSNKVAYERNVENLLEELEITHRCAVFYEYSSYNWRLHHFLAQRPRPEFDLIFIDGAHTWETDGFSFLLAEQLLKPGGWFIFDDLTWAFDRSPNWRRKTLAEHMPNDERTTCQVQLVFDLLVKPHPNIVEAYDDLGTSHGRYAWGYALKDPAIVMPPAGDAEAAMKLIREQAKVVRQEALERHAHALAGVSSKRT